MIAQRKIRRPTRLCGAQWLKSAMELVVGDSHDFAEEEEERAAASSTGPGARQGKRRRR